MINYFLFPPELFYTLKSQNNEIMKIREDIYENNNIALDYNTDDFYDSMEKVEASIQKLLKDTKKVNDNSEMLSELHDIVDEVYTNILQLNYEISSTAAKINHFSRKTE